MYLNIKAAEGHETAVVDAVNEVLHELQYEGGINDEHDDGWAWHDVETIDRPTGRFFCPSCGSDRVQVSAASRVPSDLNQITVYLECHAGNEECKLIASSADIVSYDA